MHHTDIRNVVKPPLSSQKTNFRIFLRQKRLQWKPIHNNPFLLHGPIVLAWIFSFLWKCISLGKLLCFLKSKSSTIYRIVQWSWIMEIAGLSVYGISSIKIDNSSKYTIYFYLGLMVHPISVHLTLVRQMAY